MTKVQQFDYSVNLLKAILWQYNDAVNLQSILQQKQDWYDANQTEFWQNWYNDVFNLQTANEFGCSVWAIILGIPLNIIITPEDVPTFGFDDFYLAFDQGVFAVNSAEPIILTLDQKRLVLQLRYFQLVSRGTIPEINKFFKTLFAAEGDVYVLDGLDMTITYVFTFVPDSSVQLVLSEYDLLPRPASVGVKTTFLSDFSFGFDEFYVNFDNGTFI